MARGVYFRTEKDGTPLATPELRISATNNRTVYYEDQTAKDAAMQAGEIKEGSIVLTGYADSEAEVLMKNKMDWDNAVQLTVAQLQTGYVCPDDGFVCLSFLINSTLNSAVTVTVNGIGIAVAWAAANNSAHSVGQAQCQVNKGDVIGIVSPDNVPIIAYGSNPFHFVPFKTVAEPVTMPVNILNNPSLPDYSRAITITAAQLQAGYTAPADGIICLTGCPAVDARGYVSINGVVVASGYASSTGGYRECQVQIPVSKNNIVRTVYGNSNGQLWILHVTPVFIPFKS